MVEEQNDTGQPEQNQAAAPATPPAAPTYSQTTSDQGAGGKTSTGLEPNLAALLSYLFGWVSGLIFFLIEKDNKFVRFHALQSLLLTGVMVVVYVLFTVLSFTVGRIPIIGPLGLLLLGLIVYGGGFVLWIMLMVKAYQGEKFKLPIIGDMAEQNA